MIKKNLIMSIQILVKTFNNWLFWSSQEQLMVQLGDL